MIGSEVDYVVREDLPDTETPEVVNFLPAIKLILEGKARIEFVSSDKLDRWRKSEGAEVCENSTSFRVALSTQGDASAPNQLHLTIYEPVSDGSHSNGHGTRLTVLTEIGEIELTDDRMLKEMIIQKLKSSVSQS